MTTVLTNTKLKVVKTLKILPAKNSDNNFGCIIFLVSTRELKYIRTVNYNNNKLCRKQYRKLVF